LQSMMLSTSILPGAFPGRVTRVRGSSSRCGAGPTTVQVSFATPGRHRMVPPHPRRIPSRAARPTTAGRSMSYTPLVATPGRGPRTGVAAGRSWCYRPEGPSDGIEQRTYLCVVWAASRAVQELLHVNSFRAAGQWRLRPVRRRSTGQHVGTRRAWYGQEFAVRWPLVRLVIRRPRYAAISSPGHVL
jgi:hypothetical protein